MEGLGDFLEKSDRLWQETKYNEQSDGFEVSELFQDEALTKLETGRITNGEILPWLDQRIPIADGDNKSHGTMRIVWLNRTVGPTPWEHEISKSNYELLLERLDLKEARQLVPDGGIICLPAEYRHSKKQSFALSTTAHFILVWTHNLVTNSTEVIWSGDDEYLPSPKTRNILECQKRLARHPMFMAFVAAMVISQNIQDAIESLRIEINQVENRTRHSPFHPSTRPIAAGSYASLSAMMSASATHSAGTETDSATLRRILDSLSGYQWLQGVERPEWAEKIVKEVDGCVEILKERLKAQENKLSYLSRRADIQLNALFNLITQQETRLSISVAQDSRTLASATKHDSTAMKTLAAVTVVFIPSTFVAALFSMPLFQWDTQTVGHSVVSRQFWMYWAVSIPLTFVTLTLWFAWMRKQERRHRARELESIEGLDREINGPQREVEERARDVLDKGKGLKEE